MNNDIKGQDPEILDTPKLSKIWFLPIIALLIGIVMVYQQWQNRGIPIQIRFETAEGLEAGKTKLKNRNVDVGLVTAVRFSKDKSHILVDIEVEKPMQSFIVSDSQFWVVRPRIGYNGVSGVSTLFSGAYIQVSPGSSGIVETEFTGLELPPVTALDAEGLRLTLVSDGGKSLQIGNPVVYNGLDVGRVESFEFNVSDRQSQYGIFIRAPYHHLVTTNTFFWNVSGISFATSTQGLQIDVASLDSLLKGGVQFDVPDDMPRGQLVTQAQNFQLFDSKDSISELRKYAYLEYVILVEDSIGGLTQGSPVEYRGIRVGTVSSLQIGFDEILKISGSRREERIPVVLKIEPGRISNNSALTLEDFKQMFDQWILDGITASIESGNFLTGSLKVSLTPKGISRKSIEKFGDYAMIPAESGGFASFSNKLESILAKVEKLPLDETLANVNKTFSTADTSLLNLDSSMHNTLAKVNKTIGTANTTLLTLENTLQELQVSLKGVQPNSSLYKKLTEAINQLQNTLNSTTPIIKEVSSQPNSLIFGKTKGADILPKAPNKYGD